MFPGFQVYVFAPAAESVALLPAQIMELLELADTVGEGLTVIKIVAVFWQDPLAPVTVYALLAEGVIAIDAPLVPPGLQV